MHKHLRIRARFPLVLCVKRDVVCLVRLLEKARLFQIFDVIEEPLVLKPCESRAREQCWITWDSWPLLLVLMNDLDVPWLALVTRWIYEGEQMNVCAEATEKVDGCGQVEAWLVERTQHEPGVLTPGLHPSWFGSYCCISNYIHKLSRLYRF